MKMKGKIIGIKPMGSHESCLKCVKRGSHIAYYDIGDGLLHAENLCDLVLELPLIYTSWM